MVDQLANTPRPTPMLEEELSRETLDAIKAIVIDGAIDGAPENSQSDVKSAILDTVGEADVAVAKSPKTDASNSGTVAETDRQETIPTDTIKKMVKENHAPEPSKLDRAAAVEKVSKEEATAGKTYKTVSEVAPEADSTAPEIELIRQTVEKDLRMEDACVRRHPPEAGEIPPPGVALRLKRHLRNKLRMHALILKMKLRDRLPTKREAIRAMTPRRLAIAVILAAVLLEPWFIPTVLVVALFFGSLLVLLIGPDRTRHYGELMWKRYQLRNPDKARELRIRMMARMETWQGLLEKLPSKWTQGLHMPQFQSDAEKSAAETAYATRMSRMARDEVHKSYS